ncbi:MAG TPA: hypothetical protein VKX49_31590 [Bryobacteraceae bacterium]|nr:hypothetical protein [Bryobacteraceae bacterium]
MARKPVLLFLIAACASAQVTIQVGGQPVGSPRNVLNFTNAAGASVSGIVQTCSEDRTRINCSSTYNSAFIATHDTVHENENYCNSTNGTSGYTCALPFKRLGSYRAGMTFLLTVDAPCATSCSLNVDGAGVVSLKKSDGLTDPAGMIAAGQPQWIFYDGKVFRLVAAGGAPSPGVEATATDSRGDVRARRLIGAMDTMTYGSSIALDVTAGDLHKLRTTNSSPTATINAATAGLEGQHMWIIVTNDQVSGKTIAFGEHFRSAGLLAGTAGKSATIQFVSDGTAWYEVTRTLNL